MTSLSLIFNVPCGLHNSADYGSWAPGVNGRDQDETVPEAMKWTIFVEMRAKRDVGTSRDRLEIKTSRPRPQPCRYL